MDVCMYGWVTSFFGFGGCLLKEERRDLLSLGNFLFLGGKAREQNFAQISILYHQNRGSRISPKITISKQCTNRYGSCSTINNSPYYFEPFRLMHAFYDFKRLKKKKNIFFRLSIGMKIPTLVFFLTSLCDGTKC